MKTSTQLQKDVIEELRWDFNTRECEIGVAAKDGVVTLSGEVSSYSKKLAAERAAERVSGVRAIAEELIVKLPSSSTRSDTELAHAAVNTLRWDIDVPDDKIQLKVENGWITMEGGVQSHFERSAAERAVRNLTGVRGISNHITIQGVSVKPDEVVRKIKAALHRSAEFESNNIVVETMDGRVTLRGSVRSWAERMDAERAAWQAPGVTALDDQLVVSA